MASGLVLATGGGTMPLTFGAKTMLIGLRTVAMGNTAADGGGNLGGDTSLLFLTGERGGEGDGEEDREEDRESLETEDE